MAQQWVHMARSAKPIWTTKKAELGTKFFGPSSFSDFQKHLIL